MLDIMNTILQWIVAPLAAFAALLYRTQQSQATEIAVLRATVVANREAHEKEVREVRALFAQVIAQLNSIEMHLRK